MYLHRPIAGLTYLCLPKDKFWNVCKYNVICRNFWRTHEQLSLQVHQKNNQDITLDRTQNWLPLDLIFLLEDSLALYTTLAGSWLMSSLPIVKMKCHMVGKKEYLWMEKSFTHGNIRFIHTLLCQTDFHSNDYWPRFQSVLNEVEDITVGAREKKFNTIVCYLLLLLEVVIRLSSTRSLHLNDCIK